MEMGKIIKEVKAIDSKTVVITLHFLQIWQWALWVFYLKNMLINYKA
jgi:hypothetical protein